MFNVCRDTSNNYTKYRKIAKMALLNPWMEFEIFLGQQHSFEAL